MRVRVNVVELRCATLADAPSTAVGGPREKAMTRLVDLGPPKLRHRRFHACPTCAQQTDKSDFPR